MQSELGMTDVGSVIRTIESVRGTQSEVDSTYESLCSSISTEMKQTIQQTGSSSSQRKCKIARPYWNDELDGPLKTMADKERDFLRYKGGERDKMRKTHGIYMLAKRVRQSFTKGRKGIQEVTGY